jgi:hypothetical protein
MAGTTVDCTVVPCHQAFEIINSKQVLEDNPSSLALGMYVPQRGILTNPRPRGFAFILCRLAYTRLWNVCPLCHLTSSVHMGNMCPLCHLTSSVYMGNMCPLCHLSSSVHMGNMCPLCHLTSSVHMGNMCPFSPLNEFCAINGTRVHFTLY